MALLSGRRQALLGSLAFLALTAAAFNMPGTRSPSAARIVKPESNTGQKLAATGYSGSNVGYELGATNTNSSSPFNVYGVEGYVPYDVGGVGVLGYGEAEKSYGVYGVTFGYNGIGVYGAGDGPTPAPSTSPDATQWSTGVAGNSRSGNGVYGSTEFPNDTDPVSDPVGGVMGVDAANDDFDNSGVVGLTINGFSAVSGISSDGPVNGSGDYSAAAGVFGFGTGGVGTLGASDVSPGALGESLDTSGDDGQGDGIGAVTGETDGGVGVMSQTYLDDSGGTSYLYQGRDANDTTVFEVDNLGNVSYAGTSAAMAKSRVPNSRVKEFVPTSSHPTTEDFGMGQLVNGVAYIHLDPTFSQAIDDTSAYMVFLTPEGDTKGLYVTQKSLSGFAVRENQGGRSTVSFSYRIVAQQYGAAGEHMALVQLRSAKATAKNVSTLAARSMGRIRASFKKFAHEPRGLFASHLVLPRPNLSVEGAR